MLAFFFCRCFCQAVFEPFFQGDSFDDHVEIKCFFLEFLNHFERQRAEQTQAHLMLIRKYDVFMNIGKSYQNDNV